MHFAFKLIIDYSIIFTYSWSDLNSTGTIIHESLYMCVWQFNSQLVREKLYWNIFMYNVSGFTSRYICYG